MSIRSLDRAIMRHIDLTAIKSVSLTNEICFQCGGMSVNRYFKSKILSDHKKLIVKAFVSLFG